MSFGSCFLLLYLQLEAAESLCHLIKKCLSRTPNPSVKVVKNLHGFLCCDPTFTPLVENPQADISGRYNNTKSFFKTGPFWPFLLCSLGSRVDIYRDHDRPSCLFYVFCFTRCLICNSS